MGVQSCGFLVSCHKIILLFLRDSGPPATAAHECKKPRRKTVRGVQTQARQGIDSEIQPTNRPTEYRCYIKEFPSIMTQRVRMPYRGPKSFVCHTTPHSDSTSRRVPTLFRSYCTTFIDKCKQKFFNFLAKASPSGDYGSFGSAALRSG